MINVASLVTDTSSQFTQNRVHVPLPLVSTFTLFHKVHVVWRTYRRAKVYANPDNFLSLAAGHAINFAVGDRVLVRISAVCVLISKRILDVVRQMERFQTSYGKVIAAIKDDFPQKVKFDSKKPPCFSSDLKYYLRKSALRVKRIALAILGFLKESFLLSMKMMDAVETFYLSPSTRNEGVQEMFVNSTKVVDKLEKNQKLLYDGLNKHKRIIQLILKGLNSSIPVDQFTQSMEKTVRKTVRTMKVYKPTRNRTLRIIFYVPKYCLKTIVENTFLEHLIPKSWEPMPYEQFRKLVCENDPDRFPKKKAITRSNTQTTSLLEMAHV